MLNKFEKKIADFITKNELFDSESKVLLAISGGADSIALLHVINALKNHGALNVDLHCAHVNHQLRAEQADRDEDFVTKLAAQLKYKVTTKKINVRQYASENKLSIETAARKLRIENLTHIAEANNCNCIATGHQKNDNTETIIHRLLRGTGYRGLVGIWPERKFNNEIKFVRPLLCVTRDEIIQYLYQKKISWCEDYTNIDCTYTRNYIRHQLLPALQQESDSSLVEQISDLSVKAGRFYKKICSEVDKIWLEISNQVEDAIILELKMFQSQPHPVKIELIRSALDCIGCGQRDLTQGYFKKILHLAGQNITGKKIELPGDFIVRSEYKNMIFSKNKKSVINNQEDKNIELMIPGKTQFGRYMIEAKISEKSDSDCLFSQSNAGFIPKFMEHFDLGKIELPLILRFRKVGDRFIPLGQAEEKKVGKFLTAQRVPHEIRQKILIIKDRNKIIWVCPVRISEQTRINNNTQKILQLKIIETK